jgi:hypothetical protein
MPAFENSFSKAGLPGLAQKGRFNPFKEPIESGHGASLNYPYIPVVPEYTESLSRL